MVTILLDTVVALLLGATILYAIRLDSRLKALRQGRGEMQALLLGIQEMTARAEAGIVQFKSLASGRGAELEAQMRSAGTLKGDLAMLIERAEGMAERLHDATRAVRMERTAGAAPAAAERPAAGASLHRVRPASAAPARPAEAPAETAFVKALRRAR